MDKRITFNTETPNDQGGIIPNEVIVFDRFDANPVLLLQHQWEKFPVGLLTERKLVDGKWTGVPDFHRITEESKICHELYVAGYLKACSIGGFSEWETTAGGQHKTDANGNRICALFDLYEVSMCTLPSNKDAVTLAANEAVNYAKIYDKAELTTVARQITTLSSQLKNNTVEPKPEELAAKLVELEKQISTLKAEKEKADKTTASSAIENKIAEAEKALEKLKAEKEAADKLKAGGSTDISGDMPSVLKMILDFGKELIGLKGKADGPSNTPPAETPKPDIINPVDASLQLPTKIQLKAKKEEAAKKKADEAKEKAQDALEKAKEAKTKAEGDDATEEMRAAYEKAKEAADKAMQDAKDAEAEYKAAMEDDDDDVTTNAAAPERTTNAAAGGKTTTATTTSTKPQLKTMEQLNAEHANIVPIPRRQPSVPGAMEKVTFSSLAAEAVKNPQSTEGKIFNRVMKGYDERTPEDYAVLAQSIQNDPRLVAVRENLRLHTGLKTYDQLNAIRVNPKSAAGGTLEHLCARIKNNQFTSLTREGTTLSARERTTLSGSDTLLASPDLAAIEWLSLVIFALYPSTGWKKDIPVFAAQDTYNNRGVIWTNIAADPTIYRGTPPSNNTPYTQGDTPVSLAMVASYLPKMLFTPITMHQYRYDQMGSQWAQAFAKWGAVLDDNFINTFAAIVPQSAWVNASGVSTAIGNGPNKFYYNQAYSGNVLNAAYNDVTTIEQIYKAQNFDMSTEKAVLVLDSIMDRGIRQDPDTKSFLTRWVKTGDTSDNLRIDHTDICERSRVAMFDPSTNQVKDINASIPSTAQSAGLGFIPSQLGIGLGMLDVFVLQSATNYGYEMSANIRSGCNALRQNAAGLALYNFGVANV